MKVFVSTGTRTHAVKGWVIGSQGALPLGQGLNTFGLRLLRCHVNCPRQYKTKTANEQLLFVTYQYVWYTKERVVNLKGQRVQ